MKIMREAVIVLSLFNIFLAFSKHFLVEVHDKKGKVKPIKNAVANNKEYGTDYGDYDDEDYEVADVTEGKKNFTKLYFKLTCLESFLFTEDRGVRAGEVSQCSSPVVRHCQPVRLNYHNLNTEGQHTLRLAPGNEVRLRVEDKVVMGHGKTMNFAFSLLGEEGGEGRVPSSARPCLSHAT